MIDFILTVTAAPFHRLIDFYAGLYHNDMSRPAHDIVLMHQIFDVENAGCDRHDGGREY
jgi:hypothetical protein